MIIKLKDEYSSEEEIRLAIAEYNKDKKSEDKKRYCSYFNSFTRKRMYVSCTVQQFYDWRNMIREEHRQRELESRCVVPSEKYNCMVHCMEDCEHCPYGKLHRDKNVSIDENFEKYELELVDEDQPDILTSLIEDEREKEMWYEISLLDEESQQILKLFNQGLSDAEISNELHLKRSTVQYKRKVLIEDLKNKLKNFLWFFGRHKTNLPFDF